jgi:hypothetical protein
MHTLFDHDVPAEKGTPLPPTRWRTDVWIGCFGLIAALAVMPLPTVAETPEIASVLAVVAVALLAGQRWALPIVVLADIALIGALWPRAFIHDPPSTAAQIGVVLGLAGALPGIVAFGRAAPALAELVLGRATQRGRSFSMALLVAVSAIWIAAPLM